MPEKQPQQQQTQQNHLRNKLFYISPIQVIRYATITIRYARIQQPLLYIF